MAARGPDAQPDILFNLLEDEADAARLVLGARQAAGLLADPGVRALASDPFLAPRRLPIRLLNKPGLVSKSAGMVLDLLTAAPSRLRRPLLRAGLPGLTFLDALRTEDAFSSAVLESAAPMFHVAGTCGIGRAVDPGLAVLGLHGLWVADASVMPTIPRANTNIPTIMIAEKAADMIKAALRCSGRSKLIPAPLRLVAINQPPLPRRSRWHVLWRAEPTACARLLVWDHSVAAEPKMQFSRLALHGRRLRPP